MIEAPLVLTDRPEEGSRAAGDRPTGLVDTQTRPDPLGDVLASIRLTGALFFVVDASSPWCVEVPHASAYAPIILPQAQHVLSYHVTVEGEGFASIPGIEPISYAAGDIVVFPHGDPYLMQSAPGVEPELDPASTLAFFRGLADGSLPFVVTEGGGKPPPMKVICGFLGCDARPFNPVLASLPRMLILRRSQAGSGDLLARLIDLTMEEARAGRPGGRSVSLRLSELMFVELLRRYAEAPGPKPRGWLMALRDPPVARAITAMHERPAFGWTVEVLAQDAGLSRSVFAERFVKQTGLPPLRYLTLWRIQLGARLLDDGVLSLAEVAHRVGYASEASFSRSFKRLAGVSPDTWRRVRERPDVR